MTRVCNCTGYLTNPGGRCCMDMGSGGNSTMGGYTCACGAWVPWGTWHTCNGWQPTAPAPHTTPYQPPVTIHYVPMTEERIREIIREELDRDDGEKLPGDE